MVLQYKISKGVKMKFQDLTIEQKTEETIRYFKEKDRIIEKGRKEADEYVKAKFRQVKQIIKTKKENKK